MPRRVRTAALLSPLIFLIGFLATGFAQRQSRENLLARELPRLLCTEQVAADLQRSRVPLPRLFGSSSRIKDPFLAQFQPLVEAIDGDLPAVGQGMKDLWVESPGYRRRLARRIAESCRSACPDRLDGLPRPADAVSDLLQAYLQFNEGP
jgi:hypothetical protein